jgi:hypothetical protein
VTQFESARALLAYQLAAKQRRRHDLARLPFEEKVAMVMQLQEIARKAREASPTRAPKP